MRRGIDINRKGMSRRQQIEDAWFCKAVQSNHRYDEKSFKEGAEWADKTMLESIRNVFRDLEITVNAETRFGVHTETIKLSESHIEQICEILSR